MIHVDTTDGVLKVAQTMPSPSVYLDHWALCDVSQSDVFARRFVKGLTDQGGTLVLSWWNVVEFSKMSDEAQRRKADSLLGEIGLNVFWLNPDFLTIVKHGGTGNIDSDLESAALYVRIPSCIFTAIHRAPNIQQEFDEVADGIISAISDLRMQFDNDATMRSASKSPPKVQLSSRGTRIIARELILPFLKDKGRKLNRNNAIDLFHAVVSVSYCDYVLLDGQWTTMVNEARSKLAKEGVTIPIAKVFSKRSNGVEAFLTELEGRPNQNGNWSVTSDTPA